jgi:3-hydroxymyristoyl/3-hydroxydecanoyl-(acyl carrier protein) dehydratase
MPAPPLLLCDRVLGIDVPPGELRPSTIWTETDVTWDAWYLHEGVMPPGVMIEAGQADLLLVSWLGIDFLNRGERVYRLLGCDLSWHGSPPRPGETLHYEIHIDGFASHGDVRLFFFRYDCTVDGELRLRVRGGQAGFFTDAELDESEGILWDPREAEIRQEPRLDAPPVTCERRALSREQLEAFAAGDLETCFGRAFWPAHAHVRTPRIAGGKMLLLDRVVELDPRGGPWGRGYLKAEQDLSPEAWFFDGHFHGDPCMPGTLMLEVCVVTMSIYLASLGATLGRDGWRFQPVRGQLYPMRCRGQATPRSRKVTYEVFVEELTLGDHPVLTADVLVSVDGLAAFHCRRLGLELVPDWPR